MILVTWCLELYFRLREIDIIHLVVEGQGESLNRSTDDEIC